MFGGCYASSLALVPSRIVLEVMDTSWDVSVTSVILLRGQGERGGVGSRSERHGRSQHSRAANAAKCCLHDSARMHAVVPIWGHSSISWYSAKRAVHDIIVMLGFWGGPSRGHSGFCGTRSTKWGMPFLMPCKVAPHR